MHFRPWMLVFGGCGMLFQLVLLMVIVAKRQLSRWPALSCSLGLELFSGLAGTWSLFYAPHAYRCIYWGSVTAYSLLRLFVIGDVARTFQGASVVPRKVYSFIGIVAVALALTAASYSLQIDRWFTHIEDTAIICDRAATFAWIAAAVVMFAAVKLSNFIWDPRGLRIAQGVFVSIAAEFALGRGLGGSESTTQLIYIVSSIASLSVLVFWIGSFLSPLPPTQLDRVPKTDPHALLRAISREG